MADRLKRDARGWLCLTPFWRDPDLLFVSMELVRCDCEESDGNVSLLDGLPRVVGRGALSRPLLLVFRSPDGFEEASSSSSENRSRVLESTNPGSLLRLEVACRPETIPPTASEAERDGLDDCRSCLWADKAEAPFFRRTSRLNGS